jgi:hypothetical protein
MDGRSCVAQRTTCILNVGSTNEAARRLLDAMHREPIDPELREHFGQFY